MKGKIMKHLSLRLLSLLFVFLLVPLASGCSHASSSSKDTAGDMLSYEKINQEYQNSASKLEWPSAYPAPKNMQKDTDVSLYQKGSGDIAASQLFECSWEKEWLDNYSDDTEKANHALEQLEKVPSMEYMSPDHADDTTREFFADYLNRAKLGDPSGFQENVTANCPR